MKVYQEMGKGFLGWNMTTLIKEHFVRSVESRSLSHLKKNWRCMNYQAIPELEKDSVENEGTF